MSTEPWPLSSGPPVPGVMLQRHWYRPTFQSPLCSSIKSTITSCLLGVIQLSQLHSLHMNCWLKLRDSSLVHISRSGGSILCFVFNFGLFSILYFRGAEASSLWLQLLQNLEPEINSSVIKSFPYQEINSTLLIHSISKDIEMFSLRLLPINILSIIYITWILHSYLYFIIYI